MNSGNVNIRSILRNSVHIILSFLIPVMIFGAAYRAIGIYPFGPKSVLISDMSGQYIDFYKTLYRILKHNGSLLYSWQAGMGHNFTGIFAYYLSSPFSFIILFFKEQDLADALYIMILLKIGAAGIAFSIYLNCLYKKLNSFIIAFSTMYALMSYCVVYSFNIMWLDGVIMLPIVLLGTLKIIKENKFILFTLSLALTFIANFYISYMIGLFSFLFFIAGYYTEYSSGIKVFLSKFKMYILSAVLAAGFAAFLMVPTYFALNNGLDMPKISIFNIGINFNPLNLPYKLPIGAYDTLTVGLPNIYCGLLTLIAAFTFFLNKKISRKEKTVYIFLVLFMLFSFIFSNLNLMWHGFDEPNWFPFRYSFLFSFIVIDMAAKCVSTIDGVKINYVLIVPAILLVIFFSASILVPSRLTVKMLRVNIVFITIYTVLLLMLIGLNKIRKVVIPVLLSLIIAEGFINTFYLLSSMDREFRYVSKEDYNKPLNNIDGLISKIKERDNSFYRIERVNGVGRSFNDSMNLNYYGIAHFSSMINGKLNNFLNKVGFTTPVEQAVGYCGATLLTDSLLGVKYVLSDRTCGFGYNEVLSGGNVKVYENKYCLPVGFAAENGILHLDAQRDNPFEMQNDILSKAVFSETSDKNRFFSPLISEIKGLNNVELSINGGKQEFKKIDKTKEAYVELEIENTKDQQVYGYLPHDKLSIIDIYVNGSFIESYMHFYNNTVFNLGYYKKNEKIKLVLFLKQESFTILNKYFYGLDDISFDRAINKLKTEALEVSKLTDTSIKGRLFVDKAKVLFTSIPYDLGWSVTVDGKRAPVNKIGGAFIGVELSMGMHEINFNFTPKGLFFGMIISCLSLLIFSITLCIQWRRKC